MEWLSVDHKRAWACQVAEGRIARFATDVAGHFSPIKDIRAAEFSHGEIGPGISPSSLTSRKVAKAGLPSLLGP